MINFQSPKTPKNRRFIAVDLENIVRSPRPTLALAISEAYKIQSLLKIQDSDLVVVAGACGNALVVGHVATQLHGQARCRNGRDGADLALLEDLIQLPAQSLKSKTMPINEIVIASGDHIFAEYAKRKKSLGIFITVLAYRQSLSFELAQACNRVIYLDQNEINQLAA